MTRNESASEATQGPPRMLAGRRGEWTVFAFLAVFIWPFIAVAVVGGYGFAVWMVQLIVGPPGPPGG
ncbi:MAG: periplasmic nitrate reductase, NapE protein [Tistlia sp.]|uniref:periplasmic nitrate reductase, NapE protein n=1 Tax=Tistlia sp. TaxID=3057121 RepID=UPI0034A3D300